MPEASFAVSNRNNELMKLRALEDLELAGIWVGG
jgi:hypothetical protein